MRVDFRGGSDFGKAKCGLRGFEIDRVRPPHSCQSGPHTRYSDLYARTCWPPGCPAPYSTPTSSSSKRQQISPDVLHYPDILVLDKDYQFKYALEGTEHLAAPPPRPRYPWKRHLIEDADFYSAKVQVTPELRITCHSTVDFI